MKWRVCCGMLAAAMILPLPMGRIYGSASEGGESQTWAQVSPGAEAPAEESAAVEAESAVETESAQETESSAGTETAKETKTAKKKKKGKWVRKKGYTYYKNGKGKLLKGMRKVGKKYYYFDKKGRQRTGWRKIGKNYYFFRHKQGAKGCMLNSRKINGVKLKKNGKAVLTSTSKRKLKLMVRCSRIVDEQTLPKQTEKQKLKALFTYCVKHFKPRNIGDFRKGDNWDMWYAEYMLDHGYGDCFAYGAIYAYLANAAGCKDARAESSGGHGWAEVDGKFYDPDWAYVLGTDKVFAVPASLSGVGGRPRWFRNRLYVKKI